MTEAIGFIGLGKMGMPMAANLLAQGYEVYGLDLEPNVMIEFQRCGGKPGEIKEWISKVDFIILMLPSSNIVNQVVEKILEHYDSEKREDTDPLIIIDMSSSYPSETRKNELKLKEKNITFIDAPVSGGVKKAISATLTIMIGGSVEAFEKCKRFLNSMGSHLFHVGPIGSGHLIKAINNYLSGTHLLATCEAVQLLQSFNVNPENAIQVFNQSTGRSGSTEYKFPSFVLTESYNSGFSLDLLRKDLEMAKQLFTEAGADTPLPQLIFNRFQEAGNNLEKEADHTEIYQYVSSYLLKRGKLNEKNTKAVSSSTISSINI